MVLYLLLVDAAVETVLSRSPVRWWAAVIVAGYFVATAVLWRRRHPIWSRLARENLASISLLVLLVR